MQETDLLRHAIGRADTIIHLGAGECSELPEYLAHANRQIVLVEANPRQARALAARTSFNSNVHVVGSAVSGKSGRAVLNIYNLVGRSSLRTATGLLEHYPGLRLVRETCVSVRSACSLLHEFGSIRPGEVCVIIDTPGEEGSIVEEMASGGGLERVGSLVVRCPRTPMYEGALSQPQIVELLNEHGFDLAEEPCDSAIDPMLMLRRNQLHLQTRRIQEQLTVLGTELAGLRQMFAVRENRLHEEMEQLRAVNTLLARSATAMSRDLEEARHQIETIKKEQTDLERERDSLKLNTQSLELHAERADGQIALLRGMIDLKIAGNSSGSDLSKGSTRAFGRSLIRTHQTDPQRGLRLESSLDLNSFTGALKEEEISLIIKRVEEHTELRQLDANILQSLREALRPLSPRASEWIEFPSEALRASLLGVWDPSTPRDADRERLWCTALSAAALLNLRDPATLSAIAAVASEHGLSEKLCLSLLEARRQEARPPNPSTAAEQNEVTPLSIRSASGATRRRSLACIDSMDMSARALSSMYQESRQSFLDEIGANRQRLQLLMDWVSSTSVKAQIYLPPLIRNDPAAWLWRFEYVSGLYELPTVKIFARMANDLEWMIDGGAHVGYFSWLMKRYNPNCDLLAVEANPTLVEVAKRNLATSGAHIVHGALTDSSGSCSLFLGSGHSNSSLVKGATSNTNEAIMVPAVSIDELFPNSYMSRPGIVKLDIEAFELEALQGASQLLKRNPYCILVLENNPRLLKIKGQRLGAVHEYLRDLGFRGRQILDSFALSKMSYIDKAHTRNYLFATDQCWKWLGPKLFG